MTPEVDPNLQRAWEFVEHTGISIFLTGKAGTGKTTFLRHVMDHSAKTAVVVAPTGVAAVNANGVTIHSFFQLSPAPYIPGAQTHDKYSFSKQKLRVIRSMDLLIIDEISMVRSDLLDAIDNALRKYRRDSRPFGGVQLLMIGDLQQLAPVVTPADEAVLRAHYSTPYFFGSRALAQIPYVTIALQKVYRQQNTTFVDLLNHLRDNTLTPDDRRLLASRLNPSFIPPENSGYIRLTTHNHQADSYNENMLRNLPGAPVRYRAKVTGTFPEMAYPTGDELILKAGAQVMFVKNDTSATKAYYNGLIGTVRSVTNDTVTVAVPGKAPITVAPQTWENSQYTVNETTNTIEQKVQGTFTQIPLRLAWAITIHKSQGLTFDHVIIDAGMSFSPGQVYVAMSRCRTLEGMVLVSRIPDAALLPDREVAQYISTQNEAARRSEAALQGIKNDYARQLLIDLFTFRDIYTRHDALLRVVAQTFRVMFPEQLSLLQISLDELRSKVLEVSDKWTAQLRLMPYDALTTEDFLLRVRRSAVYFHNSLVDTYGNILSRLSTIKSDNKRATTRVADLTADLRQALLSRLRLLSDINTHGYTPANYLIFKQKALLAASAPTPKSKKSPSTTPKYKNSFPYRFKKRN